MSPARLLTGLSSMALLVLGLVALLPDCASACSCGGMRGSEQQQARHALAHSSAVFAGEVVSITNGVPHGGRRTATFTVSKVWKGPERETLEVSTARYGFSCGYRFSEGQRYLVYAYGKEGPFKVDACGETRPLSKADAHIQALGRGEAGGDRGGSVLTDTSGGFPPLGVIGMMRVAVMAVSWGLLMRLVRRS